MFFKISKYESLQKYIGANSIAKLPLIEFVLTNQCWKGNFGIQKVNLTPVVEPFLIGPIALPFYGKSLKRDIKFLITAPAGLNIFSGTKNPSFTISYFSYHTNHSRANFAFGSGSQTWEDGLYYNFEYWQTCPSSPIIGQCIILAHALTFVGGASRGNQS